MFRGRAVIKKHKGVIIQIALNKQFIFKIKYLVVFDNFWELLYRTDDFFCNRKSSK